MALVPFHWGNATIGRNKVLRKLGRLTGHNRETTTVVGTPWAYEYPHQLGLFVCPLRPFSLSLPFSPYHHLFFRYLYLHDTCVAYDATRSFTRSSSSSASPLLLLLFAPFLAFPRHPPSLLLSTPVYSSPFPEHSLDHEHRYHDRISPSKFPLVRAGSQSNNHLRALHSYLTRRGSRFYTAPTSFLLPYVLYFYLPLLLSCFRFSSLAAFLLATSNTPPFFLPFFSLSLSPLYSFCIPLDTLADGNGVSQTM